MGVSNRAGVSNSADVTGRESPRIQAAERFEVLAGDLIHRLDVALRDQDTAGRLEPHGVQEAVARLRLAIEEHAVEVAAPLGEQASFLIERQGEMLRSRGVELAGAQKHLTDVSERLEKIARAHAETVAEYAAWRKRHEAETLRLESQAELARARHDYEEHPDPENMSCKKCGLSSRNSVHGRRGDL